MSEDKLRQLSARLDAVEAKQAAAEVQLERQRPLPDREFLALVWRSLRRPKVAFVCGCLCGLVLAFIALVVVFRSRTLWMYW